MLKANFFYQLWVSWVSFACGFFVFLSCLNFFFYFCTTITTGTTITITNSSVSKGEGTSDTSYKLWSSEFQSFGGRKERTYPKLVLLPTLSLGSTHTHTHTHKRFDCSPRSTTGNATPHTFAFLVHGFSS
jgi:hypothetical protein